MRDQILRCVSHQPVPIKPNRLAISQLGGDWTSPYAGRGLEFRSHRPYQIGDDLRTINMMMSVRSRQRMVVERVATRDISLLVILDCSPSMGVRHKSDILLASALMLVYSGMILEMRVGAAMLSDDGFYGLGIGMGKRHGFRLFSRLEEICSSLKQGNKCFASFPSQNVPARFPAGCMLFYLSDFLDKEGYPQQLASIFPKNISKYDFVPVVIQDEFEYSFPNLIGPTLLEMANPETGSIHPIWIGQAEGGKIKVLHSRRFAAVEAELLSNGTRFIHLEAPEVEHIHKALTEFFLYR